MIHGESIACPAVLTGTWPAALAARHGTGCLLAKVGQPMRGSQERAARSPACHSLQTASDLFTSPCVCVCFRENDRHGHDNNTHHALCSHTREGAAFHSRLNYTGLIGFFCPASKTKTLLSLFSTPLLQGPSIPSFLSPVLFFPSSQVISISLCLLCIDFSSPCRSPLWASYSCVTVISLITQAAIIRTHTDVAL